MTNPTITVGHGFMDDCDSTTGWTKAENGITGALTTDGDVFTITCTNIDNVAYEYVNYTKNPTDFSGTQYKEVFIRWKTSSSATPGVGFGCYVTYTDATSEFIIGTAASPEFSSAWKVTHYHLTANKTIATITFFASDSPATLNTPGTTYYVYLDFILFCDTHYPFPNVTPGGIRIDFEPHIIDMPIPSRKTDITQNLGEGNTSITVTGDIDTDATWYGQTKTPTNTPGEIFYALTHVAGSNDTWEWFTSDRYTGKVTIRNVSLSQDSEGTKLGIWMLTMKEYRLVDPSIRGETFAERYGLT